MEIVYRKIYWIQCQGKINKVRICLLLLQQRKKATVIFNDEKKSQMGRVKTILAEQQIVDALKEREI